MFSIAEILRNYSDEADILDYLIRHRASVVARLEHLSEVDRLLNQVIAKEREARTAMQAEQFEVQEKQLDNLLIAGVRMRGQYSDCGKGFARLGKKFGRHMCGKPMLLHYDCEYKEHDADFEACVPIRKGDGDEGISVRELPGGRAVTLLHKGPYDELGRSYEKIIAYVQKHQYKIQVPSREVYIKGPGMIFRGNPQKYLTEIQMLIDQ